MPPEAAKSIEMEETVVPLGGESSEDDNTGGSRPSRFTMKRAKSASGGLISGISRGMRRTKSSDKGGDLLAMSNHTKPPSARRLSKSSSSSRELLAMANHVKDPSSRRLSRASASSRDLSTPRRTKSGDVLPSQDNLSQSCHVPRRTKSSDGTSMEAAAKAVEADMSSKKRSKKKDLLPQSSHVTGGDSSASSKKKSSKRDALSQSSHIPGRRSGRSKSGDPSTMAADAEALRAILESKRSPKPSRSQPVAPLKRKDSFERKLSVKSSIFKEESRTTLDPKDVESEEENNRTIARSKSADHDELLAVVSQLRRKLSGGDDGSVKSSGSGARRKLKSSKSGSLAGLAGLSGPSKKNRDDDARSCVSEMPSRSSSMRDDDTQSVSSSTSRRRRKSSKSGSLAGLAKLPGSGKKSSDDDVRSCMTDMPSRRSSMRDDDSQSVSSSGRRARRSSKSGRTKTRSKKDGDDDVRSCIGDTQKPSSSSDVRKKRSSSVSGKRSSSVSRTRSKSCERSLEILKGLGDLPGVERRGKRKGSDSMVVSPTGSAGGHGVPRSKRSLVSDGRSKSLTLDAEMASAVAASLAVNDDSKRSTRSSGSRSTSQRQSKREYRRDSEKPRSGRSNGSGRSYGSSRSIESSSGILDKTPDDDFSINLNTGEVDVQDDLSHTNYSDMESMEFSHIWNNDGAGSAPPDIQSILKAVLKSKILEPRSRQDRAKKEEIQKLRACLNEVMILAAAEEGHRTKSLIDERDALSKTVKDQMKCIDDYKSEMTILEEELEAQKKLQANLQEQVQSSREHAEALKAEINDLESQVLVNHNGNGEASSGEGGGPSVKEFMEAKARVTELEEELRNATTVPQLQIEELDDANKVLEGKLKAERLETNSKLAAKDETIKQLRRQLESYETSMDAKDLTDARQKLTEARENASAVRKDLEATKEKVEQLRKDRDALMETNKTLTERNAHLEQTSKEFDGKSESMNAKVMEWMDQAYDWKEKAEAAERKVAALNEVIASGGGKNNVVVEVEEPHNAQGLFLQAAMEKKEAPRATKWNLFRRIQDNEESKTMSADEQRLKILQEQKHELEVTVAELRRENAMLKASHKGEMYNIQHKLEQLTVENDQKVQRRRSESSQQDEAELLKYEEEEELLKL